VVIIIAVVIAAIALFASIAIIINILVSHWILRQLEYDAM
jgi:hypothetical protein